MIFPLWSSILKPASFLEYLTRNSPSVPAMVPSFSLRQCLTTNAMLRIESSPMPCVSPALRSKLVARWCLVELAAIAAHTLSSPNLLRYISPCISIRKGSTKIELTTSIAYLEAIVPNACMKTKSSTVNRSIATTSQSRK